MSVSKTHNGFAQKIISVFVLLLMTISIFTTTFAAAAITQTAVNDGGGSTQSTTPTSITLNRSSMTLYVGDKGYLSATISPSSAKATVYWLSTNTSVAYASGGTVEAKAPGTATITAKISDSIKARCTVTVLAKPKCASTGTLSGHEQYLSYTYSNKKASTHDTTVKCSSCNTSWTLTGVNHIFTNAVCRKCDYRQQATGVTISQTSANVYVGSTVSLTANLTPSGSAGTIQWLSTNPNVASVSNGTVKGVAAGTATITAKVSETIKARCTVTVLAKPKCSSSSILSGHDQYLSYSYSNKKASTHDTTIKCSTCNSTWTNAGESHIFANGACNKCGYKQQATSISLNRSSATITVGNTLNIAATISPSGSEGTIQWLSTNTNVVYARKNGTTGAVLEAKAAGTATVTAKISDSIKATCTVTVVKEPKCSSSSILSGHNQSLKYTYTNKKASTHDVTTTCSSCNISWTTTGKNHSYTNNMCVCGYKQQATSISLNRSSATITVGNTLNIAATISPSGSEGTIQWLSTNTSVVYARKNGTTGAVLEAKGAGTATVTAKISDSIKATCVVTVTKEPKCNSAGPLSGHDQNWKYSYTNIKASTHDTVITCSTCNTSWTVTGANHIYVSGSCNKCGYRQQATGISLSKTSARITVGDTTNITATISPSGSAGTIQWLSTNTNVVYARKNGTTGAVLEAKAEGTAIVTAKISDTIKATCSVTVVKTEIPVCSSEEVLTGHDQYLEYSYTNKTATTHDVIITCTKCDEDWTSKGVNHMFVNLVCNKCGYKQQPTSITLNKTSATLVVGNTLNLTASLLPAGTEGTIQWLSSKTSVATVSKGTVKAVAVGTATITAKYSETVKATCVVTVVKKEVCNSSKVLSGHDQYLKYEYSNKKANTHDVKITCTVCNESWDNKGVNHMFVNGLCNKCGEKQQATAVVINQTSANIREEETLQLSANIMPTTVIDKIEWTSSNPKIATVNSNGLVTGIKAGTAKITAKASNGVKSVCTVIVSEKEKCSLGNILAGHEAKIKVEYSNSKGDTHYENFSCTECGTSWEKEKIEHTFDNGLCKCGKEEKHEHTYVYTRVDDKYHKITCLSCDYNENVAHTEEKEVCECGFNKEEIACKHPSYEWTTIKEATCKESGIDIEKCIECGETRNEKVVEVEHKYKAVQIKGDALCHLGVCQVCGEEGTKEIHIFGIFNKCIICKYEIASVKCQDGNVLLYHGAKVIDYEELDEENHIAVFECKKCKDEFKVQGVHVFMFGKCMGCGYEKVVEGVCTAEKTIEGHEHKVVKTQQAEDKENHITTYKCETCNQTFEKLAPHVFEENGKCVCGATVDVASFYSNGTATKKVKDNGGITTGTDQKLSKKAAKAAIEESDAVDFTAFSSGLHNLETFVDAYKDVTTETGEVKPATVRLIEPAYMKIGNDKSNSDGTFNVFVGENEAETNTIKENVKIELVIGEKGGPGREATYQATIELYVKLKDAGYNVELYAVNQDTVKINGKDEKCINIEYTPKRSSQHETAQDAAIEYWDLEK